MKRLEGEDAADRLLHLGIDQDQVLILLIEVLRNHLAYDALLMLLLDSMETQVKSNAEVLQELYRTMIGFPVDQILPAESAV
jgi:hypothetical protein